MEERLHKVLACAGVASRRKCEELILQGRVRVNGQVVTELGAKVDPARDTIEVDGRPIAPKKKVYVVLHKPRGYLSDTLDFRSRPSALSLVPAGERLYPAGRLDARSEGLLLLTNDGELAHRLTHPRYEHQKEYLVLVEGEPSPATLQRMLKGLEHKGEWLRVDAVEPVRRLCAALGHPVHRLIRTRIGGVELGDLPAGKWRYLTLEEVKRLVSD